MRGAVDGASPDAPWRTHVQYEALKGTADDGSQSLLGAQSPAFPSMETLGAGSPALTKVIATHAR